MFVFSDKMRICEYDTCMILFYFFAVAVLAIYVHFLYIIVVCVRATRTHPKQSFAGWCCFGSLGVATDTSPLLALRQVNHLSSCRIHGHFVTGYPPHVLLLRAPLLLSAFFTMCVIRCAVCRFALWSVYCNVAVGGAYTAVSSRTPACRAHVCWHPRRSSGAIFWT